MIHSKALRILPVILLLLSSACSLSGTRPAATPTAIAVPSATSTAPAATKPAPEIPTGPLSMVDLYQARVQAGEWTEGEALVNLLGMYTGAAQAGDVLGSYTVEDFEATGLLRLASQYLTNNPHDPLHDEVQKQVNLLAAPLDRLERFARKHSLSAAIHLASLSLSPPRDTGDQETCQQLWNDGFSSTTDVVCFEFDERMVNGTSLRLYYPSWWAADDARRARLPAIVDAASHAIQTYNTYGPVPLPPVTLVITELVGVNPASHLPDNDLHALAIRARTSDLQCYVGLFPSLFALPVEQSQQALAHEMFHCYQYQNLSAQESGPAPSANEWWVEGSAEYFSNVVYPAVNYEHRWLDQVFIAMEDESLFQWSYKAFIFFQYLENRPDLGTAGILDLLRSMPSSGGLAEQTAAMSAYSNMDVVFHEFGKAVVDKKIIDSDHTLIPLAIPTSLGDIVEVVPGGSILGRGPFTLGIYRIVFLREFDYDLTMTFRGHGGLSSARLENVIDAWGALPNPVISGCGDVTYLVVVTQVDGNPGNTYSINLVAASRPSTHLACSCINGTWLLDNSSYLTHLNGIIAQSAPGSLTYTSVTGSDTVRFTEDGHLQQTVDQMLINADSSVAGMSIQVSMDGTSNADYTSTEGQLSFSDYEANLTITTLLDNQPIAAPSNELASGPLGSHATYVCSENTLTLTPIYPNYSDLPPLTFTRQSP